MRNRQLADLGRSVNDFQPNGETKMPRTPALAANLHIPELVNTHRAAEILGRSPATLKRWRYEGAGPNWIEIEGRVSYDVKVLLEYIQENTRIASVRAAMEEIREAL